MLPPGPGGPCTSGPRPGQNTVAAASRGLRGHLGVGEGQRHLLGTKGGTEEFRAAARVGAAGYKGNGGIRSRKSNRHNL